MCSGTATASTRVRNVPDPRTVNRVRGVTPPSLRESCRLSLKLTIFGALAEFERNLIRERTSAGLAAARVRGRVGGRPPKMTTKKIKQAKLMRDNGMSQTEIAEILGVGRTTLYRHLK
ncbi:Site-specific recombinases, DNA invertase Pin homologs [Rhodococcus rhodochrous J38]|nr:Site-specific recombinases, DNA invertase Pin homologs [Rhodococcus rhodochrous J38]